MAEANEDEGNREVEAPDEEVDSETAALMHIGRYSELRRALPWQQWTFREKANYCIDRIFLVFLSIFLLVLLGEAAYKMWYVTNVSKIMGFLLDSTLGFLGWLFTQQQEEELIEL